MLFILHVVMKTLDKTCCHVYIYDQCLYDNMTIVGMVMNKEQALEAIQKKIEEAKDREDRLQIMGYIQAVFDFGLLDHFEVQDLNIKAMGVRL